MDAIRRLRAAPTVDTTILAELAALRDLERTVRLEHGDRRHHPCRTCEAFERLEAVRRLAG